MDVYFHDDTRLIDDNGRPNKSIYNPVTFEPNHGHRGVTHAATVRVDYPYQVEQWVIEAEKDMPDIVRIECPSIGREWKRIDGRFVESGRGTS
jgi:hypothetical protein